MLFSGYDLPICRWGFERRRTAPAALRLVALIQKISSEIAAVFAGDEGLFIRLEVWIGSSAADRGG